MAASSSHNVWKEITNNSNNNEAQRDVFEEEMEIWWRNWKREITQKANIYRYIAIRPNCKLKREKSIKNEFVVVVVVVGSLLLATWHFW